MASATSDYPFELGDYHRGVTCTSPEAQRWFNRGMVWCNSFHHEESIWCFEQCLKEDPSCAMAHFGIAFAHGPDYNVHVDNYYEAMCASPGYPSMEAAAKHSQLARDLAESSGAQPAEVALIEALQCRCAWPLEGGKEPLHQLNARFAEAMRGVSLRFPDDPDVAVVLAEALMTIAPWKLFSESTYVPAAQVEEIRGALERALRLSPRHPGANHLLIHLMEMSPTPEQALGACALLLEPYAPDAPHLLHMPSHIYMLLGRYGDAVRSNVAAVRANTKLYTRYGDGNGSRVAGTTFYIGYTVHDYHMLVYAAMFAGNEGQALSFARQIVDVCPESTLRMEGMAAPMEAYHATEAHVLVRFGRWEEILALAFPADPELWAATTATLRYARTVAFAALGRVDEADAELNKLHDAAGVMEGEKARVTRVLHNNTVPATLEVAKKVAAGEVLYRKGRLLQEAGDGGSEPLVEAGLEALREAAALEDALNYDEPWGWTVPARHALGGLLLEQGRAGEAAAVYRSDMSGFGGGAGSAGGAAGGAGRHNRHPENLWSLRGLAKCLEAGAERAGAEEDAPSMERRLEAAGQHADVEVAASCACVRSCAAPRRV